MLDSIKNKSLIHWFWSNCTFGYSIVALSIVYIVFVLFEIKNFYSILLFIFALNWVWGSYLYQLSLLFSCGKCFRWIILLVGILMLFPFLLIYLASFYVEMLSDKHIFKLIIFFVVNYYIITLYPMKVLVLSAENNWERKLIIVLTYLLIMLIPIFLFGVYDYCIYHSDLIETLNSKGAISQVQNLV